ncbi:hypothetical protein EYZ11_002543 [Aspergillus tanneri]|uniref:Benzoate 4-monooxygenase cytochrome P450 n=1 Tax=Aspergillus tanneri TaxID=1220188 RepID=A0A4S3JQG7_9EURO|nr:hypothetical protein EYZ11_002543 [Aspergillus tanneri]
MAPKDFPAMIQMDIPSIYFPLLAVVLIPCVAIILIQLQRKSPTIPGVPGSSLDLLFYGIGTKWAFLTGRSAYKFQSLHESYGKTVRFAPGQATTNTIKALRNIYGSGSSKGPSFLKTGFYRSISRRNLFTATDPHYHARVRKLFGPSLSPGCMSAHAGVVRDCVLRLHGVIVEKLQSETETGTLTLNRLLYCHSVDTVSEVLLGKPLGCLQRGKPYFWTEQLPRIFFWAMVRDQFQGRRDVMVEVMERAGDSDLPEEEIAENFSAIMLAGFHTTQNALCAAIYFVLTHEEAHVKLVQELRSQFTSAEDLSGERVQQLPYLNAVIVEALRLYPPVPLGGPRVSQGGYVEGTYIPEGTEICTSLFALHRNPEYFQCPDEFIPERWTEDNGRDRKEAVQPFLVGSRSCIAKYFAKQMMQMTLAGFFLDFDAQYVGGVKDWQRQSRCYAFWEVPDLTVKLQRVPSS